MSADPTGLLDRSSVSDPVDARLTIEAIPVGRRVRRRDELEALGLLLGILGTLLVLAVTVGAAPRI